MVAYVQRTPRKVEAKKVVTKVTPFRELSEADADGEGESLTMVAFVHGSMSPQGV